MIYEFDLVMFIYGEWIKMKLLVFEVVKQVKGIKVKMKVFIYLEDRVGRLLWNIIL